MNNSTRVIRELKAVLEQINAKYRPDDVVAIGLRYSDKSVDKIECFLKELVGRLFMIIDGQDPVCNDHKNVNLQTVFICDSSGAVIYDSKDYTPSKQKAALRFDGDRRLLAFRSLIESDKEQVVNLTLEQIWAHIKDIGPNDDLNKTTGAPDSAWGEMPWDSQK